MTINDFIANYLFSKADNLLADGTTAEAVKEAFSGIDISLKGLSETEMKGLFEDTPVFKSYVDRRTTEGIKTNGEKLRMEYENERSKYNDQIENLKKRIPMSEDPEELRKQALDEPDPAKREVLKMRADNIEIKNQLAERTASEARQLEELKREKLVNVARATLGDRKLPKSIMENIHMFVGVDEDTTKEKISGFTTEWDDFTRDIKTASVSTTSPEGPGGADIDGEAAMNEKMANMSFLNT